MNNTTRFFLFLFIVFHSGSSIAIHDYYHFERIGDEEGLSQNSIRAIAQDARGFMWFGSDEGLNRYDGRQVKPFSHDPEDPGSLSNISIKALCLDQEGMLWVGTSQGLNRLDPLTEINTRIPAMGAGGTAADNITALALAADGVLWIGAATGLAFWRSGSDTNAPTIVADFAKQAVQTLACHPDGAVWIGTSEGLIRFDPVSGQKDTFSHDESDPGSLSNNTVRDIHIDPNGEIWVGTLSGLNVLNAGERRFRRFESPGHKTVTSVHKDSSGKVWVTTPIGLKLLDTISGDFRSFVNDPGDLRSISANQTTDLFESADKVLWIGTVSGGVNKYINVNSSFVSYRHNLSRPDSIGNGPVFCFIESRMGDFWLGMFLGAYRNKPGTDSYIHYVHDPENENSLSDDSVFTFLEDGDGRLWLGTKTGLDLYNHESDSFTRFGAGEGKPLGQVFALLEGAGKTIWVGSANGLYHFDKQIGIARRITESPDSIPPLHLAWTLASDNNNGLWIGTRNQGLLHYDPYRESFVAYGEEDGLNSMTVYAVYPRDDGVWLGTGGGLTFFRSSAESTISYGLDDGLPVATVYGILEDDRGFLWLSTTEGISRFNQRSGTIVNFDMSNGLLSDEFNLGAYYKARDGRMYFGNTKGFNAFYPKDVRRNTHVPSTTITGIAINKEPVQASFLVSGQPLVLDYQDDLLEIKFAALDYVAPRKNKFSYKMEGLSKEWVDAGNQPLATFINPGTGDYTFRVKAANNDGIWSSDHPVIRVHVNPPPWLTVWAYAFYAFVAGAFVAWYLYGQKRKLEYERLINERLRKVDRLKDEFLANTSHELRTPLNGIIGLVDSLMDGAAGDLSAKAQRNLALVLSSGRRLANLVNDILDFSKLRHASLDLHRKPVDLRPLTDVVLTLCEPLMGRKELELINNIPEDTPVVFADEERLQQIMYNLIENGIKFTEHGRVEVSARVDGNKLEISVSDTGIGIAPEHFGIIFESFKQADNSIEKLYGGTGLGLAITRQLVELHEGRIWVMSEPGHGSVFLFTMPLSKERRRRKRRSDARMAAIKRHMTVPTETLMAEAALSPVGGEYHVLVVDDDHVNRQVLVNHLSLQSYNIIEADSGEKALEVLDGPHQIGLVLLDIMMPRVSGYEVCKNIREVHPVQDLPVIFMTARDQDSDRVAAFEFGGNDYLTKPVSKNELLARVKTHLELAQIHKTLEKKVEERTQTLQVQNKELETLDGIVKAINREIDLEDVMRTLLEQALQLFPHCERGLIYLLDEDENKFNIISVSGFPQPNRVVLVEPERLSHLVDDANSLGDSIFINREHADFPGLADAHLPDKYTSLFLVLEAREAHQGYLVLISELGHAFDEAELRRLGRFREHAVSAVAKASTLHELQSKNDELLRTQGQLIMQEKMASLGILTAGIAHEIKNPLNFVNNFSELCVELSEELQEEMVRVATHIDPQSLAELKDIVVNLEKNVGIIHQHGTRANNIVQSMMLLSQGKPGERQMVALNDLLEEYANLAYQGRRLKESRPWVKLVKQFDPDVGEIELVPSNIGRVVINLVNNAYDAVIQKARSLEEEFQPEIWVCSRLTGSGVEVRIRDNGSGIPKTNLEKVFNPFFTTKPTGKGNSGLGLAICYDIIVQEHAGDIEVDTEPGEFTEFILFLPTVLSLTRRNMTPRSLMSN